MSDIPPGAYDDVARLQTDNILRPDGQPATAFNAQAQSLKAVRRAVIEQQDLLGHHDLRLAALEARELPFPFGGA